MKYMSNVNEGFKFKKATREYSYRKRYLSTMSSHEQVRSKRIKQFILVLLVKVHQTTKDDHKLKLQKCIRLLAAQYLLFVYEPDLLLERRPSRNRYIDSRKSSKLNKISFEEELLGFLKNDDKKRSQKVFEEIIEVEINSWIQRKRKDVNDLMKEAALNIGTQAISDLFVALENISLAVLVSIYCTRGENFSAKLFKDSICAEEGVLPLHAHKLYVVMQKWRKYATEENEQKEGEGDGDNKTIIQQQTPQSRSSIRTATTDGEEEVCTPVVEGIKLFGQDEWSDSEDF